MTTAAPLSGKPDASDGRIAGRGARRRPVDTSRRARVHSDYTSVCRAGKVKLVPAVKSDFRKWNGHEIVLPVDRVVADLVRSVGRMWKTVVLTHGRSRAAGKTYTAVAPDRNSRRRADSPQQNPNPRRGHGPSKQHSAAARCSTRDQQRTSATSSPADVHDCAGAAKKKK